MEVENQGEEVLFSPPLYRQRYLKVAQLIEDHGKHLFSKVVDMGCAEIGLFPYLKNLSGIKEIVFADKDELLLKECSYRVNPMLIDCLLKREEPLSVTILCADARNFHIPFLNADVVSMIELIEHFHEDVLIDVVSNVFGSAIRPKMVIVTTPNADFNKFFPNLPFGKFRHFDHKFEWSEKEFRMWCSKIIEDYPDYEVFYDGCGIGEKGICCSQIAIFISKCSKSTMAMNYSDRQCTKTFSGPSEKIKDGTKSLSCCDNFEHKCFIVHSVEYPFDQRSAEEKQKDNLKKSIGSLCIWLKSYVNMLDYNSEVDLTHSSPHSRLSSSNHQDDGNLPLENQYNEVINFYSNACHENSPEYCMNSLCLSENKEESPLENRISHQPSEKYVTETSKEANSEFDQLKFKFRRFSGDHESFFESPNGALPANQFWYFENDDSIIFSVDTFTCWAGVTSSDDEIRIILKAFEEIGISMQKLCSGYVIIYLLNGEESDESSDDRE